MYFIIKVLKQKFTVFNCKFVDNSHCGLIEHFFWIWQSGKTSWHMLMSASKRVKYVRVCVYVWVFICVHSRVHVWVWMSVCVCVFVCVCVCVWCRGERCIAKEGGEDRQTIRNTSMTKIWKKEQFLVISFPLICCFGSQTYYEKWEL